MGEVAVRGRAALHGLGVVYFSRYRSVNAVVVPAKTQLATRLIAFSLSDVTRSNI